jgi:hypothetical protein
MGVGAQCKHVSQDEFSNYGYLHIAREAADICRRIASAWRDKCRRGCRGPSTPALLSAVRHVKVPTGHRTERCGVLDVGFDEVASVD